MKNETIAKLDFRKMNNTTTRATSFKMILNFLLLSTFLFVPAHAQFDWATITIDNDAFVDTDNGYTNGFYVSLFETGESSKKTPDHDFWVTPLLWSLPSRGNRQAINAYMIGQTMITPSDITTADPGPDEIPYSALLSMTNSYVTYDSKVADQISVTIGLVGPLAFGEEVQTIVHEIIGSDEPQGWDTQLENEPVFQFSRARAWRSWMSKSHNSDLIFGTEINAGTITSEVNGSMVFRMGSGLEESYVTTLFSNSRMVNPSAINGGKYAYLRIQGGYLFNQIFTDGNTFRDSRSIDYDHEFIELSLGFTYSWRKYSMSFAITDANVLQRGDEKETLKNLTEYGTLTFGWRL